VDTFWHIDQGKISVFSGHYDDYLRERMNQRASLELELTRLEREKKSMHESLMKEQKRAAKSRAKGEKSIDQRKWPTIVSKSKALNASETSGRKKAEIFGKKTELQQRLAELRIPEVIIPRFSLTSADIGNKMLVTIKDGSIGYEIGHSLFSDINLSVSTRDRLAIKGDNGSGKTTLIKAILSDPTIIISGEWIVPKVQDIGYVDQHYGTLNPHRSVLDSIQDLIPQWTQVDARRHLSDFLFRKNEEVTALVSTLSGGEKARLSLAMIAAKTPRLLILDEMTNNIDLETRQHIIEVLKAYPGALIVISHDEDFLQSIGVQSFFECGV
jgi:ATPase subunit of ABC transporter with duplicated ATPase domains